MKYEETLGYAYCLDKSFYLRLEFEFHFVDQIPINNQIGSPGLSFRFEQDGKDPLV